MLHPSVMYQAYFRFLKINQLAYPRALTRSEDGAVEGLTSIYQPIDAAGPLGGRRRRFPTTTSPCASTRATRSPDSREPRPSPRPSSSRCSRTTERRADRQPVRARRAPRRPGRAARGVITIDHLLQARGQPRHPDRGRRPTPRPSSGPTAASPTWRRSWTSPLSASAPIAAHTQSMALRAGAGDLRRARMGRLRRVAPHRSAAGRACHAWFRRRRDEQGSAGLRHTACSMSGGVRGRSRVKSETQQCRRSRRPRPRRSGPPTSATTRSRATRQP